MQFFIMEREGLIKSRRSTENQCKETGHETYKYTAKVVFDEHAVLNNRHFIVDHAEIDKSLQESTRTGSCEQMHDSIIAGLLANPKLSSMIACKITIFPIFPNAMANLTKVYAKNKMYLKYLSI